MIEKLLKVSHLEAAIEKTKIIKNFNLEIKEGETHVIMGPNGSGKSTFSKILVGHPSYEILNGKIEFLNEDLLCFSPEVRAHKGLFLAFQHPVEISGVTNYDFLRIAYNEKQKYLQKTELNPLEFMTILTDLSKKLKIKTEFLNRNLNEGFSGGEKKKNEILQMLLLNPKLIILDEIDSGLDIDALKIICKILKDNFLKTSSFLIITHYPRILDYLKPDYIHIMINGEIIKTGNVELLDQLETLGYESFY